MQYNFEEVVNRKNTQSFKWDLDTDPEMLPMWVADMDFKTCPEVLDALSKRVNHGVFGYTMAPSEFFEAIVRWWEKRHAFKLNKEWIVPVTGVIPATSAVVRSLTQKGDKILLQAPVYNHFYLTLKNCDREVVESSLIYADNNYSIDFDDFENKCADPQVKLFVLCNPHNPVGRVYTKEELTKVGEICMRYNVLVLSDEIHSDLVFEGHKHIPFASLGKAFSKNSVTCSSPSKTFNLAGLQVAYIFSENVQFKDAINHLLSEVQESNMLSPFAVDGLIASYTYGDEWLKALKEYLHDNYLYVIDFLKQNLSHISAPQLEATYLIWLDCRRITNDSEAFAEQMKKEHKIWLNAGNEYGLGGQGFLRLNIGCSRKLLKEAMDRLKIALAEA